MDDGETLKAERAFHHAVEKLTEHIDSKHLPLHVTLLSPRITTEKIPLGAEHATFLVSTGSEGRITSLAGAIISTVSSDLRGVAGSTVLVAPSILGRDTTRIKLAPAYRTGRRLNGVKTSFAHLVLLFSGNRAVVLVPTLQKALEHSRGKWVDLYVGSQGPDRHLLLLAAGQKIVDKMRELGVNAELHVPASQHIVTDQPVHSETMHRILAPFQALERHYESGEVTIGGVKLNTVNLSRPK